MLFCNYKYIIDMYNDYVHMLQIVAQVPYLLEKLPKINFSKKRVKETTLFRDQAQIGLLYWAMHVCGTPLVLAPAELIYSKMR